jgi:hypothetical protein
MNDLSFLKVIGLEINDECQLTDIHKSCPRNSDRWSGRRRQRPASDEELIGFVKYCVGIGFNGEIIPSYYNEALCTPDRLMRFMDALPECKFYLVTNGVSLKGNEHLLRRMNRIAISYYNEADKDTIARLLSSSEYKIEIHKVRWDNRNDETVQPKFNPFRTFCRRLDWEINVDYYGHLHMCCGDWRGEIEVGNVQDVLVDKWNELRMSLNIHWDEKSFGNITRVCQLCTTRAPRMSRPVLPSGRRKKK